MRNGPTGKIRRLLKIAGLASLAALLGAGCGREAPRTPVILFSIDTLRADRLGCYGYPRPTSPRIDEFARDAVLFESVLAPAPETAPSHMSIFTALSPAVHGVRNYRIDLTNGSVEKVRGRTLSNRIKTLPEFLKAHGYLTLGLHGGGQIGEGMGFGRGFDLFDPAFDRWFRDEKGYLAQVDDLEGIEAELRRWIRRSREEGKPLFCFLHHYACHDPYLSGPEEIRQRFLTAPVPGLPRTAADIDFTDQTLNIREQFFRNIDPERAEHRWHFSDLYDGGVLLSDLVFGRILDLLREEGIYEEALVILLSDHGEEFYEHRGGLHWTLFRETIQVPLIIKFPGGDHGGKRVSVPVQALDVFPTVATALGLDLDERSLQGTSLLPLLTGGGYRGNPVSFSGDALNLRFSQDGYTYMDQRIHHVKRRLFAESDPLERENLAEQLPEVLNRMREEARRIKAEHRARAQEIHAGEEPAASEADGAKLRELRALGYIN